MQYIVTVKLPRNPEHDPKNKVTGPCPLGPGPLARVRPVCTDVTGEHHSVLIEASSVKAARERVAGVHITRIEEVG